VRKQCVDSDARNRVLGVGALLNYADAVHDDVWLDASENALERRPVGDVARVDHAVRLKQLYRSPATAVARAA
jgi:hypothetical protein